MKIWKVKIVHLKSKYLAQNEESRIFNNILSEETFFGVMKEFIKDDENMSFLKTSA